MVMSINSIQLVYNSFNTRTSATALGKSPQAWSTFTSTTRSSGTTYTNSTGAPILVVITFHHTNNNNCFGFAYVDNIPVGGIGSTSATQDGMTNPITLVVPNNSTYKIVNQSASGGTGTPISFVLWSEFR
jgi:hypothetical protein